MIGYDSVEEHYTLEDAAAANRRMAELNGKAWCVLRHTHRTQGAGLPIYSIASGESLKADRAWMADWEVVCTRDPAVWRHHRPEFRSNFYVNEDGTVANSLVESA